MAHAMSLSFQTARKLTERDDAVTGIPAALKPADTVTWIAEVPGAVKMASPGCPGLPEPAHTATGFLVPAYGARAACLRTFRAEPL